VRQKRYDGAHDLEILDVSPPSVALRPRVAARSPTGDASLAAPKEADCTSSRSVALRRAPAAGWLPSSSRPGASRADFESPLDDETPFTAALPSQSLL
jgi:hypothetical protein